MVQFDNFVTIATLLLLLMSMFWIGESSILAETRRSLTSEIINDDFLDINNTIHIDVSSRNANEVVCDGKTYQLNGDPVDVFTPDVTYAHDGVEEELPPITSRIRTQRDGDEIVTYVVSSGESSSSGQAAPSVEVLVAYRVGEIADNEQRISECRAETTSRDTAADGGDAFATSVDDEVEDVARSRSSSSSRISPSLRCEGVEHRVVELAVAYDSAFCGYFDSNRDDADVAAVLTVELASRRLAQACVRVRVSRLEGYCDPSKDPYVQGVLVSASGGLVDASHSGCKGVDGLLDGFEHYYNTHREGVRRDAAHLFTGTVLVDDHTNSNGGCANSNTVCMTSRAYAVSRVTFTDKYKKRSTLVAHELGHNLGAVHVDGDSFVMNAEVGGARNGFDQTNINRIKSKLINETNCTDVVFFDDANDTSSTDCLPPFLESLFRLFRKKRPFAGAIRTKYDIEMHDSVVHLILVLAPVSIVALWWFRRRNKKRKESTDTLESVETESSPTVSEKEMDPDRISVAIPTAPASDSTCNSSDNSTQ